MQSRIHANQIKEMSEVMKIHTEALLIMEFQLWLLRSKEKSKYYHINKIIFSVERDA